MNFAERLSFYERRYLHEIDLREKLEGRIRTPLVIIGVVAGVIGYLIKNTVLANSYDFHWLLFFFLGFSSILFVGALYFFVRAIVGYHYQLLPTSNDLEFYYQSMLAEYKKVSPAQARKWADGDYERYLFKAYVEYASQNMKNNDAKALNLHRCVGCLAATFANCSLAFVPYYLNVLSR